MQLNMNGIRIESTPEGIKVLLILPPTYYHQNSKQEPTKEDLIRQGHKHLQYLLKSYEADAQLFNVDLTK